MNKHTGSTLDIFLEECGVGPLNKCCMETMELCEKRFAIALEKHTTPPIVFAYEEKIKALQARLDNALAALGGSDCDFENREDTDGSWERVHWVGCRKCAALKKDKELANKGEG